jgi:hypothetical protein
MAHRRKKQPRSLFAGAAADHFDQGPGWPYTAGKELAKGGMPCGNAARGNGILTAPQTAGITPQQGFQGGRAGGGSYSNVHDVYIYTLYVNTGKKLNETRFRCVSLTVMFYFIINILQHFIDLF